MRHLIIRPSAEADLQGAYDWYEEQRVGLGEQFLLSVTAAFATIQRTPFLYAVVHEEEGIRRALVRRFPYMVLYQLFDDAVIVTAVYHAHRAPIAFHERD